MMQSVEKVLAEAVDVGFLFSNTGMEHTFFLFTKIEITDSARHGLKNKIIHNTFERCTQSEVLV